MKNVIEIKKLSVSYKTGAGLKQAVKGVSFSLKEKELLALVGGSGCGKSTICKAVTGLLGENTEISGEIEKNLEDTAAMVFQDPYLSLDPTMAVGRQVEEAVSIHIKKHCSFNIQDRKSIAEKKALELLDLVGIEDAEDRYNHIPLSFSGGMRQRISIAIALAMEPDVIIADEITSSLDRESREQIIELLNSLRNRLGTSILLVTHDLGLVKDHCDRIMVMKDGQVIEEGSSERIFSTPENPYTKDLLRYANYNKGTEHTHGDLHFHNSKPHSHEHDHSTPHEHDKVISAINKDERLGHVHHLLEIHDLSKSYKLGRDVIRVLDHININIHKGELLGISGRSGAGKTTLAKCITGLEQPDSGKIKRSEELKSKVDIQMIFQDSKSALNPRMNVREQIKEAVKLSPHSEKSNSADQKINEMIETVELDKSLLHKRPYEISGGQRQRVAIARALTMHPKLLIADEPIASLDMVVQAQMIHLIKRIQEENNLTVLFISHDIPMLMHICDRIISL